MEEQWNLIYMAIKNHDVEEVKRLLMEVQRQEDKDYILTMGDTANDDEGLLHLAIYCKAPLEVIRSLLDFDGRFIWSRDTYECLPIHNIFYNIYRRGRSSSSISILWDDNNSLADAIRMLLEYDIESHAGVKYQTLTAKDDEGMLPIHHAAKSKVSVEVIQVLLETDGRIGRQTSLTHCEGVLLPLEYALEGRLTSETVAIFKTLLDHDVNNKSIYIEDSDKELPLHRVCFLCGGLFDRSFDEHNVILELIQLLLEKDTKKTTIHRANYYLEVPIMKAIKNNGSLQIIKLLLECNQNAKFTLFKQNNESLTPFQAAFKFQKVSVEAIQFLLEFDIECTNACLTIENENGQLPIHFVCGHAAAEFGDDWSSEVIELMLPYSNDLEFDPFWHRDNDMNLPIDYIPDESSKTYKIVREVLLKEKQRRLEVLDMTFKKYKCEKGQKDIIPMILEYFGEEEFGLF